MLRFVDFKDIRLRCGKALRFPKAEAVRRSRDRPVFCRICNRRASLKAETNSQFNPILSQQRPLDAASTLTKVPTPIPTQSPHITPVGPSLPPQLRTEKVPPDCRRLICLAPLPDPITMRTHDDFMRDLADSSSTTADVMKHDVTAQEEEEYDRRKKTRVVHPSASICRDWMIVSGNCHYARDKASFATYAPVDTLVKSNTFNPHDEKLVAGVGSVHLPVRRAPNDAGTHVLVLEGVLHIPEAICNGFNPLLVGSSMSCHRDYWEGADARGTPMWFGLPFAGLGRLVLAGGLEGESDLIDGREYTLSLYISPEEKEAIMSQAVNS